MGHGYEADWRVTWQQELAGSTFERRTWTQKRPHWDHDHCAFCSAKFGSQELADWAAANDAEEILRVGWTDAGEYNWICDRCFEDFREQFRLGVAKA